MKNSQSNGTYASEANAAKDSLRFRPKRIGGTRDIVTIECLRPDDVDACKNNIKNILYFNYYARKSTEYILLPVHMNCCEFTRFTSLFNCYSLLYNSGVLIIFR